MDDSHGTTPAERSPPLQIPMPSIINVSVKAKLGNHLANANAELQKHLLTPEPNPLENRHAAKEYHLKSHRLHTAVKEHAEKDAKTHLWAKDRYSDYGDESSAGLSEKAKTSLDSLAEHHGSQAKEALAKTRTSLYRVNV